MTGLPIYEAALEAKLERIWVFLIAAKKAEAEKAIEQALLQSKLNQRVLEPLENPEITKFLNFINDPKANITSIPGIKGYAKQIRNDGFYSSIEDMQKQLGVGSKKILNWVRAYKQLKV
ncbi:hypothetical protein IQ264_17105 [Phormidium sp. LEGE 05292]|uniref:hypothetical protein n=1 Tax=[Phormidium] sp. LEGE 05292 TaxID=767427 RepID=UPI00187ECB62|nr:hypothetical protein [Phormidium sp. LEGE 05292]MBE9227149.1 hypothetical protein [Phormidium sp. LEGE 05292]